MGASHRRGRTNTDMLLPEWDFLSLSRPPRVLSLRSLRVSSASVLLRYCLQVDAGGEQVHAETGLADSSGKFAGFT